MKTLGGELIRRMAAGDREAFGRFYDRYAPLVHPLVLRIVRDPTDAADVLQEVFWAAWQAATTYDEDRGTPEAWIIMRARSRAIDRVRANRRRGETFVAPVEDAAGPGEAGGADPATRAADRAVVRAGLERLPDAQREVIELAYYEGLTQTEIAERVKQPLGTVKTRIRLGLERLREVLKQAT
ncbi:MAG: sigma-70 family RNA polymerase sigma factor [Candidatus Rokubacteria bacterium]|nr:sigma-70 family RNA polymerase sigma factor [Candidatus Rokubacteria bacterium]MBI3827822.1 sigma-70 family RNA polymerase sigma factor [Candidatus Rokubacteria bacterium]